MKKHLIYLAATLGIFFLFTVSLLPTPQVNAADCDDSPFLENCIGGGQTGGQAGGAAGKGVKEACPSKLSGYPASEAGSTFFKCQVSWAKAAKKTVPNPNNKAMSFCQQHYAGAYFEDCNKGFQNKDCGNNAVCKKGKEAKQQNEQSQDPNAAGEEDDQEPPSCESSGFNLSWIMCPFIEGLAQAIDSMYDSIIQPLLYTDPINITEPNKDDRNTFAIWSTFRIYGNVILIIALLVIIFGEAIGGGLVDAYTVRKTLPRLLVAAILINLSIYIVALAVDVSNIVGVGIQSLMEAPFRAAESFEMHLGFGASLAGGIGLAGIVGAGAALWAAPALLPMFIQFLLLFFLVPAFLGIMAVMITILIREGLIIFLTIVSPVAFALYCMPNTEKYFKQWWDLLFRTLLVFPIIAVVFAMGNILAVTINSTASGITGALTQVMSVFALILPLFLIPFSFRMAGGVMGQLSGIVQDRKNGLAAPLKKYRSAQMRKKGQEAFEKAKANNLVSAPSGSRREKFSKKLQKATLAPQAFQGHPKYWKDQLESQESLQEVHHAASGAEHSLAMQQVQKVDTLANAAMHGNGSEADWESYLRQQNMSETEVVRNMGILRQAKRDMGDSFEMAAAVANAGTGSGFAGGAGEMEEKFAHIAQGDQTKLGFMVASAKSAARSANRVDLFAPSFGTSMGAANAIWEAENSSDGGKDAVIQSVKDRLADSALDVAGPGGVLGGRVESARNLIPALQRKIQRSAQIMQDVNAGKAVMVKGADGVSRPMTAAEADRQFKQTIAEVAKTNDASGGATAENARLWADGIMSQSIVGSNDTVQSAIESLRDDVEYQQIHREFIPYQGGPRDGQMATATPAERAMLEAQEKARIEAEAEQNK